MKAHTELQKYKQDKSKREDRLGNASLFLYPIEVIIWTSEQDRESGLIFILIYKKERRNSEQIFNGNIYYSATGYSWIYRVDFEKPKGTQRC